MHRSKAKAGEMQRYFGDDACVAVILTGIQGKALPFQKQPFRYLPTESILLLARSGTVCYKTTVEN
jgi:hypothetical protein